MQPPLDHDRFIETMREQASIGGTADGGLHRLALTDADRAARDWLSDQFADLGLETRVDSFGNMFWRRSGVDPDAPPVLVGSHLDSQPNGGIYDGALGVVAALELIRSFEEAGVQTRHPVEVVNWTNEEGSRFQRSMQGSGVWAGVYDRETEYDRSDPDGLRLEDELERIGYRGPAPCRPEEPYEAYLELHIEQGPYLEREGLDVGIVESVVGYLWGAVTFSGEPDHSGPTPMDGRRDALVAAADFIIGVRRLPGSLGPRTVATVGRIDASPDSINVVAEEATVTVDVRDPDDDVVDVARERVLAEAEAAATRESVEWEWDPYHQSRAVDFDQGVIETVSAAASSLGYDAKRMPSGAGHDAVHLTEVCDTGMVFAVSEGGRSHSPAEYTSWDDCLRAADTFAVAAMELAVPAESP